MDQDIQEIQTELKKITKLTEENNEMLHSVERRSRIAVLWSIFRWVFVVAIAIGAFYYIQPYLEKVMEIYQSLTGNKLDLMQIFTGF